MKTIRASGHASYSGFRLKINNAEEHSARYKDDSPKTPKKIYFVFYAVCLMIWHGFLELRDIVNYVLGLYFPKDIIASDNPVNLFLFGLLAIVFGAVIILRFYPPYKKIWQWHSCEHKAANLFLKKKSITMRNLKQVSSHLLFCPTNMLSALWLMLFCLLYSHPLLTVYFCHRLGYSVKLATTFSTGIYLVLISIVLFPCIYCLQKLLFMVRPTEEQYKEALEIAKKIEKRLALIKGG